VNLTNNLTSVIAVVQGLTGKDLPENVNIIPNIQSFPPTKNNDITEYWTIGSIWVTPGAAYVCIDNKEGLALWMIASLQIDDVNSSPNSTYSSSKVDDLLNLKTNETDFVFYKQLVQNTITDIEAGLDSKPFKTDVYLKSELDDLLNLKTDETDFVFYKQLVQNTITDIEAGLDSKSDKTTSYIKTEVNDLVETGINILNNNMTFKADKDTTYLRTEIDNLLIDTATKTDIDNVLNGINGNSILFDRLVNLLNKWIKNGNLQLQSVSYNDKPIQDNW
jgi:hypothetical protein